MIVSQAEVLAEACRTLRTLATEIESFSEDDIKKKTNKIKEWERKGDEMEANIIEELHTTFITPFDREDIYMIAITIDKATDIINAISSRIEMYDMHKLHTNVPQFMKILVEMADTLVMLMTNLEKRTGLDKIIKDLHELEHKADYLFSLSVGSLFKEKLDATDLIKYKEIYEGLEDASDSIDYVGKIVRRALIKMG